MPIRPRSRAADAPERDAPPVSNPAPDRRSAHRSVSGSPLPAGRLRDVLAAEWIKLLTLRAPRRFAGAALAFGVVASAVLILSFPVTRGVPISAAEVDDVLSASVLGLDAAAIVLIVFAAWFVGVEFRSGAITDALIRLPRRSVIITAKATLVAAFAGLTALLTTLAVSVVAVCLAAALTDASWSSALSAATASDHLRLLFGSALMPVAFAVLAVVIAFGFGSLAAGLLAALGLIIASTLASWLPTGIAEAVQPFLPLAAIHSISGAAEPGSAEFLGFLPAVIVIAAWIVLGWVFAVWRLRSRDF
ncbi:hypothetical protein KACC15558_20500 [Brevibacterium ammoniilyticum]|uniref:ABC transporter permease n=1 Tax=Brevibacterium ammoniilyticum TaxID=1046555 RepID=A0ABP9U060_9MICO